MKLTSQFKFKTISALACVAGIYSSAAFSVDMSSYPTALLSIEQPDRNLRGFPTFAMPFYRSVPNVSYACIGHGSLYAPDGTLVQTSSHWRLFHAPTEFVQPFRYRGGFKQTNTIWNGGANTCRYALDTAHSKYYVNLAGNGVNESRWLNQPGNPANCLGDHTVQAGFMVLNNGDLVLSQINDPETTIPMEFSGTCSKASN